MAEPMEEQLTAAHVEITHLRSTLKERDHTISQLLQEIRELSETVAALQAQTLRDQEATLNTTVRGLAGETELTCQPQRNKRMAPLPVPTAGDRAPRSVAPSLTVCAQRAHE